MRFTAVGAGLGVALAAAWTVAAGGAAHARAVQPEGLYAPSALVLTVAPGEEADAAQRAVLLRCHPTEGGDHPAAGRACAALDAAGGNPAAVAAGTGRICSKIWDPVTVTAEGVWRGRHLSYSATFSNRCVMEGEKGAVFAF